jgi:hypothetical protein
MIMEVMCREEVIECIVVCRWMFVATICKVVAKGNCLCDCLDALRDKRGEQIGDRDMIGCEGARVWVLDHEGYFRMGEMFVDVIDGVSLW